MPVTQFVQDLPAPSTHKSGLHLRDAGTAAIGADFSPRADAYGHLIQPSNPITNVPRETMQEP